MAGRINGQMREIVRQTRLVYPGEENWQRRIGRIESATSRKLLSSWFGYFVRRVYFDDYDEHLAELVDRYTCFVCKCKASTEWCEETHRAISFITCWQAWVAVNDFLRAIALRALRVFEYLTPFVVLSMFATDRTMSQANYIAAVLAFATSQALLLLRPLVELFLFLRVSIFRQTPRNNLYAYVSLAVLSALVAEVASHYESNSLLLGAFCGATAALIAFTARALVFVVWFLIGSAILQVKCRQRPQDEITQTLIWLATRVSEYDLEGLPPYRGSMGEREQLRASRTLRTGNNNCDMLDHIASKHGSSALQRFHEKAAIKIDPARSATDRAQERDVFRVSIITELEWVATVLENEIGSAGPAKDSDAGLQWRKEMRLRGQRIRSLVAPFLELHLQGRDEIVKWLIKHAQYSSMGDWMLMDAADRASEPGEAQKTKATLVDSLRPAIATAVLLVAAIGCYFSSLSSDTKNSVLTTLLGAFVLTVLGQIDSHYEKYPTNLTTVSQIFGSGSKK